MNQPKSYLWIGELVSQIVIIAIGVIAFVLLLPSLTAEGFPDFGNVIYFFFGAVLLINLGAFLWKRRHIHQRVNDLVTHSNQLLAHWHYDPQDWQAYVNHEQQRRVRASIKWLLFSLAISVFVVFGWRQVFGNNITVPLVIWLAVNLFLISVMMLVVPYYRTLNTAPEALVAEDGLCIGGVAHFWKNGDVDLLHIQITQSQPLALEFKLRERKGRSPSNTNMVVPIPSGREDEAKKVVDTLIKSMAIRK